MSIDKKYTALCNKYLIQSTIRTPDELEQLIQESYEERAEHRRIEREACHKLEAELFLSKEWNK